MELTKTQKRILAGEICPYCGRKTQLVNADEDIPIEEAHYRHYCKLFGVKLKVES